MPAYPVRPYSLKEIYFVDNFAKGSKLSLWLKLN